MHRIAIAVMAFGSLTGCSMGADFKEVDAAIPAFHQQLDASNFSGIYENASSRLKNSTPKAEMIQLLSAVHRKLGAFVSGKAVGWNDNLTTNGHFVTENFSAQYARGLATESFIYQVDEKQALLAGYHISSTALIVN